MKAKEYLQNHKTIITHFDILSQIIEDLYWLRHDEEATRNYYEQYLTADLKSKELQEWKELHKKYGASAIEPEVAFNEKEVDKNKASVVKQELLKVVSDDLSFGYIKSILRPESDDKTSKLQIDQAIIEDLTTSLKSAIERPVTLEHKSSVAAKDELLDDKQRTMKVTTTAIAELLRKLGINRVNADTTTISELISYLTGFSHNTIRQTLSSNGSDIPTKSNKAEIERINQLFKELNVDIVIKTT